MYNIYETITNVVVYSKVVPAILKIKPKEMRTTKMKDEIINEIYNMLDEIDFKNDADYDLIKDIKAKLSF